MDQCESTITTYSRIWRCTKEKDHVGYCHNDEFAMETGMINVGPDAPIVENERGGKQSHVSYRYDLIPPEVLAVLARIYDYGVKRYDPDNWKKISTEDHLNHVMVHLVAYRAGDRSDDHLGHMMWRAQAALYTAIHDLGYDARQTDEKVYAAYDRATEELRQHINQGIETREPQQNIEVLQKMCSECHERPVRYNGAGYCQPCHDKWYVRENSK
jgi:hypothetical protein